MAAGPFFTFFVAATLLLVVYGREASSIAGCDWGRGANDADWIGDGSAFGAPTCAKILTTDEFTIFSTGVA